MGEERLEEKSEGVSEIVSSGPAKVTSLAFAINNQSTQIHTASGVAQETKVVFTEMGELDWRLQLNEETIPDQTLHEVAVETPKDDGPKETHIERLDEFGRVMVPKMHFQWSSYKLRGKEKLQKRMKKYKEEFQWISPKLRGKEKLEKCMKQYQEELKLEMEKNSDTPLHWYEAVSRSRVEVEIEDEDDEF